MKCLAYSTAVEMIQTLMKNFHHWNLSRMSRITVRMFVNKPSARGFVDSTAGSSSMTITPALNVERPETETVELETSGVPEHVSCQPPPVAAAD